MFLQEASHRRSTTTVLTALCAGVLFLSAPLAARAQSENEARPLETGKPVEREIAAGESHSYTIALESGQYMRLLVKAEGADVVTILDGPGGKRLNKEDTRYHSQRVAEILVVTEESGIYRLRVESPDKKAAPGRYRLGIEELRAATERDRTHIAARLTFGEATKLRGQAATAESLRNSIEKYGEARQLFKSSGDRNLEAHTLANIAAVYSGLNEYHTSLDYYQEALKLYREVSDRFGESIALHGLASIYKDLGRYQDAIDNYNSALSIFRLRGDRRSEAFTLLSVGVLYSILGETQKTIDVYDRALALFRATGDRRGEANALNLIGAAHRSGGEHQKALDSCNQALAIYRSLGDRGGEADTLRDLGNAHASLNHYEKALELYNQALDIYRSRGSRRGESFVLLEAARLYLKMGEHRESLDRFEKALAIYRALKQRREEALALNGIALVHRARGNLREAHSHNEAALAIVESLRHELASQQLRTSYFASIRRYYELDIDLLMQMHKQRPSEGFDLAALETSERARARSLLDLLVEARIDIRQGADPALLERERSLARALNAKAERQMRLLEGKHTPEQASAAAKELQDLLARYQQAQSAIRTASPQYAALTQPQPVSLEEIQQQLLDDETLLLEYALGEERSYLWAVSREKVTSYELAKRAEIEAAARRFYELLRDGGSQRRGELEEAARQMSRMLIEPVADRLAANRLLIVPDGVLHYIPFAALPLPEVQRQDQTTIAASSRPLIVRHEIVTLPSASVLAEMRRELDARKPARRAVAVFADPVFSADDPRLRRAAAKSEPTEAVAADLERAMKSMGVEGGFQRLPFSRREAEAITETAPQGQWAKALDFRASRDAATSADLSQYRIIHFATHGLLDSNTPELSGIVLSLVDEAGRTRDGFLRLHEIYNLRLPAELVVLSACRTGLGKHIRGEGIVGLTRGFMYAGAARVVASLWKVSDAGTAELMKRFYRGMFARKLRPAAALRAAQVEMLAEQRWRSPYYWAAFVLQGEWR
ncbi:MAG TPA: CHAT domain-containing tetratricopeptide repeat protein [Blastocatellia bacterium]|nr:CHAT domain-containing tetratricopeptide repeat protein [Blastocatellia bacterium]